jgi:hypothetical protein
LVAVSNVTLSSPPIFSPSIAGLSTSQVSEGSNLYFTIQYSERGMSIGRGD